MRVKISGGGEAMSDTQSRAGNRSADEAKITRVNVRVYGEDYPLKSSAEADYLVKLAAYVDAAMRRIGSQGSRLGTSRVAVLAAMQIADELFRLRQEYDGLSSVFEDEWARRNKKD